MIFRYAHSEKIKGFIFHIINFLLKNANLHLDKDLIF